MPAPGPTVLGPDGEVPMTTTGKWLPALHAATPLPEAARQAVVHRLGDVVGALGSLGAATDPEAVHALRVALRRAETALQAFDDLLPPRRAAKLRRWLRRLRRAAGEVRDLDVVLGRYQALAGTAPDRGWCGVLEALRTDRRRAANALVVTANRLRRKGFDALVRGFGARVRARGGDDHHLALGPAARPRLGGPAEGVRRRRVHRGDDDAALHALRLAARRLRYTMELFAGVFDAGFRGETYDEVERLQASLGCINDHAVAATRLAQLRAPTHDRRVTRRLGALGAMERAERDAQRERFFAWWTPARARALAARLRRYLRAPEAGAGPAQRSGPRRVDIDARSPVARAKE